MSFNSAPANRAHVAAPVVGPVARPVHSKDAETLADTLLRGAKGLLGMSMWGTTSWPVAIATSLTDHRLMSRLLDHPAFLGLLLVWLTPPSTRTLVVERALDGAAQVYVDARNAVAHLVAHPVTHEVAHPVTHEVAHPVTHEVAHPVTHPVSPSPIVPVELAPVAPLAILAPSAPSKRKRVRTAAEAPRQRSKRAKR